jgi:hypothetical protein
MMTHYDRLRPCYEILDRSSLVPAKSLIIPRVHKSEDGSH